MNLKTRIEIEQQIAHKLVDDALAAGYAVSVHDGEAIAIRCSTDAKAVKEALFSTDDDRLYIHDAGNPKYAGWAYLVYGNDGYDVICDYTANPKTEAWVAGANALAEKLEERHG